MHPSSMEKMEEFVRKFLDHGSKLKILDVGAGDFNGIYKKLFFNELWTYVGLDIEVGHNVTIVIKDLYDWKEVESDSFDVVISGQTLEHIEEPWNTVKEMFRVCKSGGFICAIAPWNWEEHKHPLDCYRFLPDGFRHLFVKIAGFEELDCAHGRNVSTDCWFMGRKP